MIVLVTGATGFLGRVVVRMATEAGHDVLALVRSGSKLDIDHPKVRVVTGDLRAPGPWCVEVSQAEAVIHLAATLSGDLPGQVAGTIIATENLLANLPAVKRFVHVSSMVVYDYATLSIGHDLTEDSTLEPYPERRGPYTETKLFQEQLVREWSSTRSIPLVVMRPGAVYGPGNDWDHGAAVRLGPFDILYAPAAIFPLVHVENCASAIVAGLEAPVSSTQATFNVFDDDLPTFWGFHRRCRRAGRRTGIPVPVPWLLVLTVAGMVELVNTRFLKGNLRLPEFLTYRKMQARWKPLRFPNAKIRAALNWTPKVALDEGIKSLGR